MVLFISFLIKKQKSFYLHLIDVCPKIFFVKQKKYLIYGQNQTWFPENMLI